MISTIAGTGTTGFSGDNGPATSATLSYPAGVSIDNSGNVYISDYRNHRIRKVTISTGIITTVAGTGTSSYSGDNGPATSATLNFPHDMGFDSFGNLCIADRYNHRIRKVTISTGIITTIVGSGSAASNGDGAAATSAAVNAPVYCRFDTADNLYITEFNDNLTGNRVRKVFTVSTDIPTAAPSVQPTYYPSLSPHSISVISTIAGTGVGGFSGDNGAATAATLNSPHGIVLDSSGNVYFSEYSNHRVRKITASTGIITTAVGTGSGSYCGDGGSPTSACVCAPHGLALDSSGNIYIGDHSNHRVRKVTIATNVISTIAGTGAATYSGDNGQATSATLYYPQGVAVDSSGNIYIGDLGNHRIRKVTAATSVISTIAGTGTGGYSGDGGQATAAAIMNPAGVNVDSTGNVYFGDCNTGRYNVIRKVTVSTGIISTVAGTGSTSGGYNGDNIQATAAMLNFPFDVVLDSYGNLYITDRYNNRVRKVTVSTGVITTVIGDGTASSSGDGAAATAATIYGPLYSRFDSAGNYYITECEGNRVRKVMTVTTDIPTSTPSVQPTYYPSLSPHSISVISTIAGTGSAGYSGDNGPATSATIYVPAGIALDSSGNVFFSDHYNHRVRKITVSTGIITTYAGTGASSFSGDGGVASSAALYRPDGLSIDSAGNAVSIQAVPITSYSPTHLVGNLYIGDSANHRVRKITASTSVISTIAGTGSTTYSGDNGQATSAALYIPIGVAVDISGKEQLLCITAVIRRLTS